jgi:hypothetical protein
MSIDQEKLERLADLADFSEEPELYLFTKLNNLKERIEKLEVTPREEIEPIRNELLDELDLISKELSSAHDELLQEVRTRLDSYKPIKGDDGHTPTNRELIALIEPLIPEAPKASDIASTASKMALDELLPKIVQSDTPDEVIAKIHLSNEKISRDKIEGLEELKRIPDLERRIRENALPITTTNIFRNGELVGRAKNINFTGDATITITGDTANVALSAGGGFNTEVPVGAINSSNTTYTVTNTPIAVVVDGMFRTAGAGYTYSAPTITVDPLTPPVYSIISIYA